MIDDMNPFEHQIAGVVQQTTRPSRPVDVMSIVRNTTTQSPKRRFGSMFSATKFVIASAIVALFGSFLLAGVLTTQPDDERLPAAASPSPSTLPAMTRVGGVTGGPSVATGDALWVAGSNRYRDGVWIDRIDAVTGEVVRTPIPSESRWLVPTGDAIWAVGREGVYRIDRRSLVVTDSIDVAGGPSVVADDSLWLWSLEPDHSSLVEIDLETRKVRNEYRVADDSWVGGTEVGWWNAASVRWVGATDGAIWMHEFGWPNGRSGGAYADAAHALTGFDVATRVLTDQIDVDGSVGSGYCCIAVDDAIWLPGPAGTLARFDVATYEVTETPDLGSQLGPGIAAAGAVWVTGEPDTLHRIDPETMDVTDISVATRSGRSPAFGDGAIWVGGRASGGDKTLSRVDVETLRVSDTVEYAGKYWITPHVSSGVVWVHVDDGSVYRVDGITAGE